MPFYNGFVRIRSVGGRIWTYGPVTASSFQDLRNKPLCHTYRIDKYFLLPHVCFITNRQKTAHRYLMDGEGFEPSKAEPPDLQSGAFVHFAIHPNKNLIHQNWVIGQCTRTRTWSLHLYIYHHVIWRFTVKLYLPDCNVSLPHIAKRICISIFAVSSFLSKILLAKCRNQH